MLFFVQLYFSIRRSDPGHNFEIHLLLAIKNDIINEPARYKHFSTTGKFKYIIIAFPLVIFLVSDRIRDCGDLILIKSVKIGKTGGFREQQSRIFSLSFNGARHSSSLNCWRPFSVI